MSDAGAACWGWIGCSDDAAVPAGGQRWRGCSTPAASASRDVLCFGGYKETVTQIPAQLRPLVRALRRVDAPPWTLGVLNVLSTSASRRQPRHRRRRRLGRRRRSAARTTPSTRRCSRISASLHRGVSADRRRANVTVVPRSSGSLELCYGLRGVSRVGAALPSAPPAVAHGDRPGGGGARGRAVRRALGGRRHRRRRR